MWLAKFTAKHATCILTPLCVKHKVTDFVSLLNAWKEEDKGKYFYTEFHTVQGTEAQVSAFAKDLKKKVKHLERKGNFIFTMNEEPLEKEAYDPAFERKIIYVKPVMVHHDGNEYWEVASWEKEPITNLLNIKVLNTKLKSMKKTKLSDVFFPRIMPKLSPKQREALELAVKEGYYDYPRNTDLETMAMIAKVKRQSFQENLRRAEKKLVPFLTENML